MTSVFSDISDSKCSSKSYQLYICAVSRLWPLLLSTTATILFQVAITSYLDYYTNLTWSSYYHLFSLLCSPHTVAIVIPNNMGVIVSLLYSESFSSSPSSSGMGWHVCTIAARPHGSQPVTSQTPFLPLTPFQPPQSTCLSSNRQSSILNQGFSLFCLFVCSRKTFP